MHGQFSWFCCRSISIRELTRLRSLLQASTTAQCQSGCCYNAQCAEGSICFGGGPSPPPPPPPSPSGIPTSWLSPSQGPLAVRLISADMWCLMLPLNSQPIGNNEQAASIQCSSGMVSASGGQLPAAPWNLLNSANFASGSDGNGNTWYVTSDQASTGIIAHSFHMFLAGCKWAVSSMETLESLLPATLVVR
jgi:hypothetical protein